MNFVITLLLAFSSIFWPVHFQTWEYIGSPCAVDTPCYYERLAEEALEQVNPVYIWDGETTWTRISEDMILHNSPIYVEHCTQLFNTADGYKWYCTGKWKVPGPCRNYKDEDGIIHMTCVQCYIKDKDGLLYDRIECPVMNVDKLLEMKQ